MLSRRETDGEDRPDAFLALDGNRATHHVAEPAADGQPQPGPAGAPRVRGVGLEELLEKLGDQLARYSDAGVRDLEHEPFLARALLSARADDHLATLRELAGVAQEIQ